MNISPDRKSIIKIENLSKIYQKGLTTIPAINNLSCMINPGAFVSIVGKSGSGKSTLLNMIGGLDTPDSGIIVFEGKNLVDLNRRQMANHRRYSIGMVFQSFNLITHRTAGENVELALAFGGAGRRKRKKTALELLEQVGLKERAEHFPNELSGGEAQRVSIARAMANNPKVLLADEPTGNLDSATAEDIISLLRKMNTERHLTIIMVTHDYETAERVSDQIIKLKDGRIIEEINR